ncbi:MAG TPA: DNA-directed RNA polymerase subunit alpha [Phycisphaerae bacterium]|jgi:DNA-directed RNA polymerase subunit alpha
MQIRWRGLELPNRVTRDESVSHDTYGRFIVEPFERGFGTTVGNSLRRILLSSLEGAAVATVKIARAPHEFTTLPGVLEDVTDIILNVKKIVVKLEGEGVKTMRVSRDTPGEVHAGDIVADPAITIVNPELVLATLTAKARFEMEMTVRSGRGYATADENQGPEQELGVIPVDSIFSPVLRVRYRIEDTRVGQRTNYERLIIEVWTRGTVLPDDALVEAAKILRKHLNPFVQYHDLGEEVAAEAPAPALPMTEMDPELQAKLDRPIGDLDLSVRARNCLESARITTVGQLATKTESDLLRVRSFGKTSLREVKRKLADWDLTLGMSFSSAPAEPVEERVPVGAAGAES